MALRYLFGPVTADFADQNLRRFRQAGHCLAFHQAAGADLVIGPADTWEEVCARFPPGWRPDFLVLQLAYTNVPACLWSAPLPRVGLAEDWNLHWHYYRRRLRDCDLILTDILGVETLRRAGITYAQAANLFGSERRQVDGPGPESPRDIDILFVGNLDEAVQRERLPWLTRLARLSERRRVTIATGVFGADYRALLARARVVFSRASRGEANHCAFEAAVAGALLFQEAGNLELPAYFRDRQECVYYTPANLEALLDYYLDHEDERRATAEAARERVRGLTYENLWERCLGLIEREWVGMVERARRRPQLDLEDELLTRTWQMLASSVPADPELAADLGAALVTRPQSAMLHNALGLVTTLRGKSPGRFSASQAAAAAGYFERALACDPGHVLAALNRAEALVGAGQDALAVAQARETLDRVNQTAAVDPRVLDAGHFPPIVDHFRVEWERAAWAHVGHPADEARAKRDLLRWRLHALLAQLTGDLAHYYEAVLARPDLPLTQGALGCALGRAKRPADAVPHLRRALEGNPFDGDIARALSQALRESGQQEESLRLARDRQFLARAAPRIVPPEPWFTEAPSGLGIIWEGDQRAVHSLARVNRELCRRLIEHGHELSLLAFEALEDQEPAAPALAAWIGRPLSRPVAVHVRHRWPPDFTPPPAGHWVMIQPWEFGSLPRAWIGPMSQEVDEVWVYSQYLRECYIRSGLPADRVQVVPLGVDTSRFHPQVPPLRLRTGKRFKLLFVGGTIYRKGIDILLETYARAFTAADDICLVIKDMGVGTFYRGQTAQEHIARHQARPGAPEIEYLDRSLTEAELAGLYTACDCLVHPYRGEGFGLPIAEAMACALPLIVTGYGAALDFCTDANAYLLPAQVVPLPEKRVGDLETEDYPWLAEPDREALHAALRHVVAHPEEARAKGQAGAAQIRSHLTWDHAVRVVEERLEQLRQRPVRRLSRPAGAGMWLVGASVSARRRCRVSLCLIVKNEEANLPACLDSAADLVDEVIVVDTGSTDRTREIAAARGARVFDFAWVDSFAAARNEGLRHATGDWIFWMDADDRLDETNRRKLRDLFASLKDDNGAFCMKCICLPDPQSGTATEVDHVRLFRNRPDVRWQYRVHEQILPAVRKAGGQVWSTDIAIQHVGYQDAATRKRKQERDLRLLHLELAEHPNDPFPLFNLGWAYEELGRPTEALDFLRRSLKGSHPGDSIVRKLYALMIECHRQLGQRAEALAVGQEGRRLYPDDAQLLYQEARLRREQGDLAGAEACLLRLVNGHEEPHFASVAAGLRGYLARHQLASLYQQQGCTAEAEAQWQATLAEHPGFLPAWQGLGDLHIARSAWAELEALTGRLEATTGSAGAVLAAVWRARGHLARQEFSAARQLLEAALAQAPQVVMLRLTLSDLLLQEGRDWQAAERALREVLALDPGQEAARHNLAVLLSRQGRAAEAASFAGPAPASGLQRSAAPPPSERTYQLRLRDRTAEVRFSVRGQDDREILHEVWVGDAYRVRELAEPPRTVVDIGAHIGAFAVMAAEAWPACRIIACECDPDNFQLLGKNLTGRLNVEAVEAAIVGEDVCRVQFNAFPDKFGPHSGGGSCRVKSPGTVPMWVPALSVVRLWESRGLSGCDLLKLDCEGSEVPIVEGLAQAGLLAGVRVIIGEWHALDTGDQSGEAVRAQLQRALQATHEVQFSERPGGVLGYFLAQRRPSES